LDASFGQSLECFAYAKPEERMKKAVYLERKTRDLTELQKQDIRIRLDAGDADSSMLAQEFGCVPTQIAALKAWKKMK